MFNNSFETSHHDKIHILLVEDNEGDALLTKYAFEDSDIDYDIDVVEDGEEAINYLHKQGDYKKVDTPDLILLDLNLPIKGGKEVLHEVKGDESLKKIPILVMSSSSSPLDVSETYSLHTNGYVVKPFGASDYEKVVKAVEDFWFKLCVLPKESD